ncbi:hypothetical protein FRC04_000597 [Tulasnella sp. 424]|nr:hypothetical protein FRC04_000597 [Tulasnella sp. 424]
MDSTISQQVTASPDASIQVKMSQTSTLQQIDSGWKYKERSQNVFNVLDELNDASLSAWKPVTRFPSEIHAELVATDVMPHPYKAESDTDYQWVGETEWLYATTFKPDARLDSGVHDLHFDGLDTLCTVFLNGEKILEANNMLLPYLVRLQPTQLKDENTLLLHFHSAKIEAKKLEEEYGKRRAGSCNLGDPSRVYVRKAQYHWRWDWGPEVMTVGPWRPIYLRTYSAAIESLTVQAKVDQNLNMSLNASARLCETSVGARSASFVLIDSEGKVVKSSSLELLETEPPTYETHLSWDFAKDETELWWPVNYGHQTLYTLRSRIHAKDGTILDEKSKRVGFRRVQLIQEPLVDAPGTTFLFEVNNQRIFLGGSNWVPCNYILTNATPDTYKRHLQAVKDGNQNCVRVWSGGIYEPDIFYDTCDELGLLVWQDFCGFACGVYPAHESFVKLVLTEAEANVAKLAHHPCIIVWCGNNEDYQQINQWKEKRELPARLFYEDVFPDIVKRLMPGVPYWPGSPYGGKEWYETEDLTVGDVHEWHVWCNVAPGEYYQNYDILAGRFVSEFGLPSFPCKPTVDFWFEQRPNQGNQRYPQSQVVAHYCRSGSYERRFSILMNENFRISSDLEVHAFLTQVMQAEGLGWAYRSWRRNWKGRGREHTAGALVWQTNDAWPATSWSLIDFFLFKKPSYYVTSRELSVLSIGLARKIKKNRENDRPRQFYEFGAFRNVSATLEVWASNFTVSPVQATAEISYYDLKTEQVYRTATHHITIPPNQSVEIYEGTVEPPPPTVARLAERQVELERTHTVVIHARLLDPSGKVLARFTNWPEPYKFIDFPAPQIKLRLQSDGTTLKVEAKNPAKCVFFSVPGEQTGDEIKWSDNAVDLFPGDVQTITVEGLNGREVAVSRLGAERPIAMPVEQE